MSVARYGPVGLRLSTTDRPAVGQAVEVVYSGTTNPIPLFTSITGQTSGPNPVTTDSLGNLMFYAEAGDYDILVNGARFPVSVRSADTGQAAVETAMANHINSPSPHPVYDSIPSVVLIYENGLI